MTQIGPRYAIIRKLGEGTFGEVFCAQHQDTGELVALKKIRIRAPENGIPKSIFREIKSMQLIDHENVLRCLDVYASGAHLVLVLDLMHSDLYQLLRNCASPLPEAVIKSIAQMMLCGLAGAHSENIIHRDLKPSNLLFSAQGVLKLGDFGLAQVCKQGQTIPSHQIATRWYRSPESLYGGRADSGGLDLWACGCILAELLNHSPLFPGENDIDQLYRIFRLRGTPESHPVPWPEAESLPDFHKISFPVMQPLPLAEVIPDASPLALDLIERLLIYPPYARLPASEALKHAWFTTEPLPAAHAVLVEFLHRSKSAVSASVNIAPLLVEPIESPL